MSLNFPTPVDISDEDLVRRVLLFLADSRRPSLRNLLVEAHEGVVTLRGPAGSFYEKQLAVKFTRRVAGVFRVIDEVLVIDRRVTALAGFDRQPFSGPPAVAAI